MNLEPDATLGECQPAAVAPIDPHALGTQRGSALESAKVKAWLQAHPDAVRQDEALLKTLGLRCEPGNIVEFGPIALSRISEAHRRESSERRRLESVARANYAAQAQTHAAVIDLLEAASPADLAGRLDELARARFGLAIGVIALEGAAPPGWRCLLEGQADAIIGFHRLARLGPAPLAAGLFGPLAPQVGSAALMRLHIGPAPRTGLLAFGAFDRGAFSDEMGSELVIFIARVLERLAERWLER